MDIKERIAQLKEMANKGDENVMIHLEALAKECKTDKERNELNQFTEGLLQDIDTSIDSLENEIAEFQIKEKLGELNQIINFSYIAKKYFGKSKQWLYQRINNYQVNGEKVAFTTEQKMQFDNALKDISLKINLFTQQ